jgi:Arc/MetJ-type ribon-helix-helix transcriptional regulator
MTLSADTEKMIAEQMRRRGFSSPDDMIRAAFSLLDRQDALSRLSADDLRAICPQIDEKIAEGLADVAAGRLSDGERFFDELEREERDSDEQDRRTA